MSSSSSEAGRSASLKGRATDQPTLKGRATKRCTATGHATEQPKPKGRATSLVVCALDELQPGQRREVQFGGADGVTVFNVGGRLYALGNRCPHKGGPLCRGRLRPHVASTGVGQWVFERENEIIKCPYHNWEFDITTGRALYDQRMRVKTYPVAVVHEQVVLRTR